MYILMQGLRTHHSSCHVASTSRPLRRGHTSRTTSYAIFNGSRRHDSQHPRKPGCSALGLPEESKDLLRNGGRFSTRVPGTHQKAEVKLISLIMSYSNALILVK